MKEAAFGRTSRKVIYALNVSLDGFIEGPNGELDWSAPDEELHRHFNDLMATCDTCLYGRRLYKTMVDYWPTADADPAAPAHEVEFARWWKEVPKIVFSKTLEHVEWNSRLVREVVPEEIIALKEQPGRDMDLGGADLASTFMRLGLIDEYRLYVHPVVLGSGKPMFQALDAKINLQLVETRTFGSGVVLLRYQLADEEQ